MSLRYWARLVCHSEDFTIQVILDRKNFLDIPNTLTYSVKWIFFIVEGRRHHCWLCGAAWHLAKMCPNQNLMLQPGKSKDPLTEGKPCKAPKGPSELMEGFKKGVMVATHPLSPEGCPAATTEISQGASTEVAAPERAKISFDTTLLQWRLVPSLLLMLSPWHHSPHWLIIQLSHHSATNIHCRQWRHFGKPEPLQQSTIQIQHQLVTSATHRRCLEILDSLKAFPLQSSPFIEQAYQWCQSDTTLATHHHHLGIPDLLQSIPFAIVMTDTFQRIGLSTNELIHHHDLDPPTHALIISRDLSQLPVLPLHLITIPMISHWNWYFTYFLTYLYDMLNNKHCSKTQYSLFLSLVPKRLL